MRGGRLGGLWSEEEIASSGTGSERAQGRERSRGDSSASQGPRAPRCASWYRVGTGCSHLFPLVEDREDQGLPLLGGVDVMRDARVVVDAVPLGKNIRVFVEEYLHFPRENEEELLPLVRVADHVPVAERLKAHADGLHSPPRLPGSERLVRVGRLPPPLQAHPGNGRPGCLPPQRELPFLLSPDERRDRSRRTPRRSWTTGRSWTRHG